MQRFRCSLVLMLKISVAVNEIRYYSVDIAKNMVTWHAIFPLKCCKCIWYSWFKVKFFWCVLLLRIFRKHCFVWTTLLSTSLFYLVCNSLGPHEVSDIVNYDVASITIHYIKTNTLEWDIFCFCSTGNIIKSATCWTLTFCLSLYFGLVCIKEYLYFTISNEFLVNVKFYVFT